MFVFVGNFEKFNIAVVCLIDRQERDSRDDKSGRMETKKCASVSTDENRLYRVGQTKSSSDTRLLHDVHVPHRRIGREMEARMDCVSWKCERQCFFTAHVGEAECDGLRQIGIQVS